MEDCKGVKFNNFTDKKSKTKISKSLQFLFVTLQIFFGLNTGFGEVFEGKLKYLLNRVSISVTIALIVAFVYPAILAVNIVWFWCSWIKCIASFIITISAKYTLFNFLTDCHTISSDVPALENNALGIIVMTYTYLIIVIKFLIVVYRCLDPTQITVYCSRMNMFHNLVITYSLQGSESMTAILIVIMYFKYQMFHHLKNSSITKLSLYKFEQRFVALANSCEKINWIYYRVVVIELFINIPRLMVTLWYMLVYIKENAEWYSYTSEWLFAFHLTIQICIPAIMAEMVNSQMDAIKLILNEQRRIEKDKKKSEELTRVLRYIKARHLQSDIWRMIPVDLRLPLGLLNLCITYFIVILQFTHLYG